MLSRVVFNMVMIFCVVFSMSAFSLMSHSHMTKTVKNGRAEFKISNLKKPPRHKPMLRTHDYPTQLFDMNISVKTDEVSFDEITDKFESDFLDKLPDDRFLYNVSGFCFAWPDITNCHIMGFFDPEDDEAIDIAKKVKESVNGTDFFGTPFIIDESRAVVVNFVGSFGRSDDTGVFFTPITRIINSIKFNSYYDATNAVLDVIDDKFNPTQRDDILSLIAAVFGESNVGPAENALKQSDTAEILIMPTFLYGDNLTVYPMPVALDVAREYCDDSDKENCLD